MKCFVSLCLIICLQTILVHWLVVIFSGLFLFTVSFVNIYCCMDWDMIARFFSKSALPLPHPSASRVDAMHVVVDQHLVSDQNKQSTLTAVQNLILLSNTW